MSLASRTPAKDRFHTTLQVHKRACFTCNARPKEGSELPQCSRCRRVVYCSAACQKKDWSLHRSLCPAWVKLDEASSARRKPYYDTYPNTTDGDNHFCRVDQDLSTFFDGMIDKDSVGVVSRQFAHEEPRCLCCYGIEGPDRRLEHCPDCMLFAWCKEGSCKWKCKNAHVWDGVCDQYRRIANMEDAVFEHENDPATKSEIEHWVPSRVRSTYKKLPSSWEAYLKRLDPPRPADHPITPAMVHLTLSIPLTILMCLERFGIAPSFADAKNRKVLTIHMVGASSGYENTAVSHTMEEILHVLPGVRILNIIYIGPEVDKSYSGSTVSQQLCVTCMSDGGSRQIWHSSRASFYHDFLREYRPPEDEPSPLSLPADLLIAFNVGILCHGPRATWIPTIRDMIDSKAPCCFTSYDSHEARLDFRAIQTITSDLNKEIEFLWAEEKNPWRGKPVPTPFTRERCFMSNHFSMGFKGV